MAPDSEPTVRGRELGDAVRLAMEHSKISGKRMAELLAWSETKVSRIVTGHVVPSEVELVALLALCGVVGGQRDSLLDLCRDQTLSNWSANRHVVVRHKQTASKITEFHNSLIPSLLRTESYTRSLVSRMVDIDAGDTDSWMDAWRETRTIFDRITPKAPTCEFFIHQLALELPIGGSAVMSDQLHQLLQINVRKNATIRIIASLAGAHPGTHGPFCLLEYSDFRPVVHIEDETEGHFLEDPVKIAKYQRLVAALSAISLDEAESSAILQTKAAQYGKRSKSGQKRPRNTQDGRL